MNSETMSIDVALRAWRQNTERAGKFFTGLSEEQLQKEIAPGKNRLIYLWGHLIAVNDTMLPLLGFGPRLHPELDAVFLSNPDRFTADTLSATDLRRLWSEVDEALWTGFSRLPASEWLQRHTAVSEEDFAREPHRNRFAVLLSRTGHVAYHFGQAVLAI